MRYLSVLCLGVTTLLAAALPTHAAEITLEVPAAFAGHPLEIPSGGSTIIPTVLGMDVEGKNMRLGLSLADEATFLIDNPWTGSSTLFYPLAPGGYFSMPVAPEDLGAGDTIFAYAIESSRQGHVMGMALSGYSFLPTVCETHVRRGKTPFDDSNKDIDDPLFVNGVKRSMIFYNKKVGGNENK